MNTPTFGPSPNPKASCDHYAYDDERCLRCGAERLCGNVSPKGKVCGQNTGHDGPHTNVRPVGRDQRQVW